MIPMTKKPDHTKYKETHAKREMGLTQPMAEHVLKRYANTRRILAQLLSCDNRFAQVSTYYSLLGGKSFVVAHLDDLCTCLFSLSCDTSVSLFLFLCQDFTMHTRQYSWHSLSLTKVQCHAILRSKSDRSRYAKGRNGSQRITMTGMIRVLGVVVLLMINVEGACLSLAHKDSNKMDVTKRKLRKKIFG